MELNGYRSQIVEDRLHPNHWFNRASDLRAAAGAVWLAMKDRSEPGCGEALGLSPGFSMGIACEPVYHMLCGLALEVIMKAVIAQRHEQPPKTHDLGALAPLLGVELSKDEEMLFQFYSSSIAWAGRYPTPNNPNYEKLTSFWKNAVDVLTRSEPTDNGSFIQKVSSTGIDDWDAFHSLWQRFANMFRYSS